MTDKKDYFDRIDYIYIYINTFINNEKNFLQNFIVTAPIILLRVSLLIFNITI